MDRQEESGKVAHLAGRKPIFATNYTNVIQIIVLDYIRLIGRQNWITFGPNECGGKEGSYTIEKPRGGDGKTVRTRGGTDRFRVAAEPTHKIYGPTVE